MSVIVVSGMYSSFSILREKAEELRGLFDSSKKVVVYFCALPFKNQDDPLHKKFDMFLLRCAIGK